MKIQKILFITSSLVLANNSFATVSINEIAAATSDRILDYSDNNYPKLGSGRHWMNVNFDDSSWKSGNGGFGFGVGGLGTDLQTELEGKAVSLYIRKKFIVSAADAAKTDQLRLQVDYDDGFIAFVNGKEIGRKNMGPKDAFGFHDQAAYNSHASGTPENIFSSPANEFLVAGTNVIAIQLHNKDNGNPTVISADLFINSSPEIQLVNHSDSWNYFIGYAEPSGGLFDLGPIISHTFHILWGDSSFNDSSWSSGPGGLGYGDGDDTTTVNVQNVAFSFYIRQPFILNSLITNLLTLTVDYDDAFIAYLNGYEIARRDTGAVGDFFAHNQSATASHEAGSPEIIPLPGANRFLVAGTNVLAVQTHNWTLNSSDMTIKADLSAAGFPENLVYYTNIWKYMIGTNEPAAIPPPIPPLEINDDFSDWIELYNSSPTSVNLKGWSLTDKSSDSDKWIFPDTNITAGGYLVILCDGKNIISATGSYLFLHTNFKLTKDGEFLGLYDNSSPRNFISGFSPKYPQQSFFHSYGWSQASNSYLYFSKSTPGKINDGETFAGVIGSPVIDKDPGFYSGVTVSITTATQNAEIRYTTDGSEPTGNSTLYAGALTFNVNTALRARAFKTGWIPSRTVTRTYLLNSDASIKNAPIISIVADWQKSIFKPNGVTSIVGGHWTGTTYVDYWIDDTPDDYNIPMQHGRSYERRTSVEFFNCQSNIWNQIDCGIRIAGSDWTRPRYRLQDMSGKWDEFPHFKKPQFNLFFRSDYGDNNLDFPVFPDLEISKFDSLRLRSGKNDWKNPFIIDEFVRRNSIKMGNVCSKGCISWLFVNGVQRAYYNLVERYDEKFFQEHYNSNEDWDIIRQGNVSIGESLAEEGDLIEWNKLLDFLQYHDLEILNNYNSAAQMMDMISYADYILTETYGANWDWPNNNWNVARERSDSGVFRFYVWDAEGCFFNNGLNGIDKDAFNQNPALKEGGGEGLNGEDTPIANIWQSVKRSAEFRLLFADRIQKHYFADGCMMDSKLTQAWNELETIIIPMFESFFPDTFDARTKTEWIPQRRSIVFQQFKNETLWPDTHAPYFNKHGGAISSGFQAAIYNTNSAGSIYYTTDGTDPRNPGGSIHGSSYSSPVSLTKTTQIKSRVLRSGEWSPICEAVFSVTGAQNIVVSEIMYHPPGGDDFEFIEIKNISGNHLDISDLSFVDGITFSFAGSAVTELSNEAYVVVVKSNAVFASLYNTNDILIAGEYEGKLANGGERIEIQGAAGVTIAAFIYSDDWYPTTDGDGYSLVIVNPYESTNLWNLQEGWRPSHFTNGSPGKADIPEPVLFIILLIPPFLKGVRGI
ncbi:chitobiase/beta-hexosaminidase C-terminal domain-containing protein [bacterium]|nr:chitobiase/beta-hexosaminidase C-terminal domain-containing protein [bacterium]